MEQLDLFAETDDRRPLTVADIDEWATSIRSAAHPHLAQHYPNEWARAGLAALLGEEIPARRWSARDLLALLDRARSAALVARAVLTPDAPELPAEPGGAPCTD